MRTLSLLGSFRNWIARQRIPGLCGLLLLIAPAAADAQPWAGIVSPSRATVWSGAGVSGGIPNRTTICATLNPGATAAQINAAIAACPSGQVVFLNAGTYNLLTGISFGTRSNVTLRGAGAHRTFLKFSGGTLDCAGVESPICVGSAYANNQFPPNFTGWTAGYDVGTTVITVESTLGMEVGDILVLDQLDDIVDGGEIFVCSNASCSAEGGNSAGRTDRSQQQLVKVVALTGNQVTITPGLRMPNWRSSQSPGVFWNAIAPVMVGNGVESLSLEAPPGLNGIIFMHVSDSWVKGVRVVNPARNHVWLYQSMRITVRDSYFYGGQSAHSTSYGIEDFSTGDNLVENNIFQHVTAPLSHNGSNTGSVFGYNFAIDDNYTASPGWMIPNILYHEAGMSHLLHEGNDGLGAMHDDIHGTTHFQTLFRNHLYGDIWNDPPKDTNTQVVHIRSYGRFFNVVGNVLGRTEYYRAIYTLGDPPQVHVPEDPLVGGTMLRWGNYDTVTGANRFLVSEVPSSPSQFANGVPATQNLPASFYLTAKPSWFGATPWPAIGPDVTGGQDTGGHAYEIPARACWQETEIDPSYGSANVRLFDPNACYGQVQGGKPHGPQAPKSPPAHLTAKAGNASVALAWRPVPRASEYRIFRATNGVWSPTPIATVRRHTYTDRGLRNGTVYSYRVAAANRVGMGPLSDPVSARPMAPPPKPGRCEGDDRRSSGHGGKDCKDSWDWWDNSDRWDNRDSKDNWDSKDSKDNRR
jgi:hypothetical protein